MNYLLGDIPDSGVYRLPHLTAVVGLKKSAIYSLISQGRFPPPVKLTRHASGWTRRQVSEWLADPTGWRAA